MAYINLNEPDNNVFEGVKFTGQDSIVISPYFGNSDISESTRFANIANEDDCEEITIYHTDIPQLIKALQIYLENIEKK